MYDPDIAEDIVVRSIFFGIGLGCGSGLICAGAFMVSIYGSVRVLLWPVPMEFGFLAGAAAGFGLGLIDGILLAVLARTALIAGKSALAYRIAAMIVCPVVSVVIAIAVGHPWLQMQRFDLIAAVVVGVTCLFAAASVSAWSVKRLTRSPQSRAVLR